MGSGLQWDRDRFNISLAFELHALLHRYPQDYTAVCAKTFIYRACVCETNKKREELRIVLKNVILGATNLREHVRSLRMRCAVK